MFKFPDFKQSEYEAKQDQSETTQKFLSSVKDLNAINDQNNPIISQVVFFTKMFDKFVTADSQKNPEEVKNFLKITSEYISDDGMVVETEMNGHNRKSTANNRDFEEKDYTNIDSLKEIIYKTYSKSITKSINYKQKEKKKMEKIMNLLIYLQMKKIEMKLSYFNDFEKLIQFETQQIKSMESQIIQERIKLAIKKSEMIGLSHKLKNLIKQKEVELHAIQCNEHIGSNHVHVIDGKQKDGDAFHAIELVEKMEIDNEPRILDLN